MKLQQTAEVRFEVPDDWQDRTVMVFAAPPAPGQKGSANVVLTRETADGDTPIGTHADQQLVVLIKSLEGFTLEARKEFSLAGRPAAEVRFRWNAGKEVLRQHVVFVRGRGNCLLTLSATARQEDFGHLAPVFQAVLGSVRFPETSSRPAAADPVAARRF
jgi:hypothetical protein